MNKIIYLALIGWIIYSTTAFSIENNIDVTKASLLADNKQYEKALKILAPCLQAKPTEYNNLEDCLYYADEISEKALRPLSIRYDKEKNIRQTEGSFKNWLSKLGIEVKNEKYAGAVYKHNYIKYLVHLFPKSKYQDAYEYKTLERGVNSIEPVQKWIKALQNYRTKYPAGRYFYNATVDLAHAYDNLWQILRKNTDSEYYGYFSSGNKLLDAQNAEKYRMLALELYEYIKNNGAAKGKYEQYRLQTDINRYQTLKSKEPSFYMYILND